MYCQLLAGLIHRRQVLRLGAVFASALLRAISFLERRWRDFCRDIRAGSLDEEISDSDCRSAMSDLIGPPDPVTADEIEGICGRSPSWKGIISRLWPNARYIEAVVTGSMSQYVPALKYYSDEKLPLVCPMYASSECYFGVNLKPLCDPAEVSFTLLPNMGYFEFIPLGENGALLMDYEEEDEEETVPQSNLVDLVHVKVGCYYELVVTTFSGETIPVSHRRRPPGHRIPQPRAAIPIHLPPQRRPQHRQRQDERGGPPPQHHRRRHALSSSPATRSSSSTPATPTRPRSPATTSSAGRSTPRSTPRAADLRRGGEGVLHRGGGGAGLRVPPVQDERQVGGAAGDRVVKSGTFEKLMDLFIAQGGASINQYKTPRCVKSKAALKLLNANVRECYF
ncbi:hypothetical protein DH2020_038854 [Rehmannia glutinosa]|uniref:Uncharacterized protein n=1 Tax=Rehmannia glutinosa TaxID=99300 RepID=A0ABR0UYK9_REHGL